MKVVGAILTLVLLLSAARAADNPRVLVGSWSGKATAPDGGPPSGDIQVVIGKGGQGALEGKILVKGEGGLQYSGEVSDITLSKKVVSAKILFKLGENPLEVNVTGPLKGKTIQGTFFVTSAQGEKIGEGTFSITRDPAVK